MYIQRAPFCGSRILVGESEVKPHCLIFKCKDYVNVLFEPKVSDLRGHLGCFMYCDMHVTRLLLVVSSEQILSVGFHNLLFY